MRLRQEVSELHERVDFTERLLANQRPMPNWRARVTRISGRHSPHFVAVLFRGLRILKGPIGQALARRIGGTEPEQGHDARGR